MSGSILLRCSRSLLLAMSVGVLAGCDRGTRLAEPPDLVEARQAAARDACIGAELLEWSRESLDALDQFHDMEGAELLGPASAAIAFARAYEQHAELRFSSLANADSAVNHARSPADSTRYWQTAEAYRPGQPRPETLEANIAAAWFRDFTTLLADEDHRCHWGI